MGITKTLIDAFDEFGRRRAARVVYHELSYLGADELARHGFDRDAMMHQMRKDGKF